MEDATSSTPHSQSQQTEEDTQTHDCHLESCQTRTTSPYLWWAHRCTECSVHWVAPHGELGEFECLKEQSDRWTHDCIHLGERRYKEDGEPDAVNIGCTKRSRKTPIYECKLHKRCLPRMAANNLEMIGWERREESKIYHSCRTCTDYERKDA